MEIRKANENDIVSIMELLVEVGNVHHQLRPDLFLENKTKYSKEELLTLINDSERPIFVYIDNIGKLCGYIFCIYQSIKGNNLVSHKSLYIDDLCVRSTSRHAHIGKSLYEHVIKYAKEKGCYNVTLNVWSNNEGAIKFYENCGLVTQKTVLEKIL